MSRKETVYNSLTKPTSVAICSGSQQWIENIEQLPETFREFRVKHSLVKKESTPIQVAAKKRLKELRLAWTKYEENRHTIEAMVGWMKLADRK